MCMSYNEACTFPSEKQKWPAKIKATLSRIGKPLHKFTSLSKCMKCSVSKSFINVLFCASPMKETMPLPWAKLPKDRSWESEPSWTSPVGLVDASSGGCLELRAGSQNGRLAGGGRAATRPAWQLPLCPLWDQLDLWHWNLKVGAMEGKVPAAWDLGSLPQKTSHRTQREQGFFLPPISPGRLERTQNFALLLWKFVESKNF